jgi:hypothetical protein
MQASPEGSSCSHFGYRGNVCPLNATVFPFADVEEIASPVLRDLKVTVGRNFQKATRQISRMIPDVKSHVVLSSAPYILKQDNFSAVDFY